MKDRNHQPPRSPPGEFMEGEHGRHGGSLESEGKPQEEQAEAATPEESGPEGARRIDQKRGGQDGS